MRRWFGIDVAGDWCAACLDADGEPALGVLMVSGGTELACGAHGGMARVAGELARQGVAVLRFDRRGVGDSGGEDPGFLGSGPDLAAALAALRRESPSVARVVGVGNCDAACALLLGGLAVDALVLTNVWLDRQEPADGAPALPPPAAIRRRYLAKLTSPSEWWRLISGGVDLRKLFAGLKAMRRRDASTDLTDRLAAALCASTRPTTVLLANGDATAIGFTDALTREPLKAAADRLTVRLYPSRSHSFAEEADRAALIDAILAA